MEYKRLCFRERKLSDISYNTKKIIQYLNKIKIITVIAILCVCYYVLVIKNEKVQLFHQIVVPKSASKDYIIMENLYEKKVCVILEGTFFPSEYGNMTTHWMEVSVQLMVTNEEIRSASHFNNDNIKYIQNVSESWRIPLVSEKHIGLVPEIKQENVFYLEDLNLNPCTHQYLKINLVTNLEAYFPVSISYNLQPINKHNGILYAALILLGLYFLIIFDIVHKTLAALLTSIMSLTILAVLDAKPTMSEIISWIDFETLLLLFSMMIIVTIFSDTGVLDNMAVLAYKLTGGKVWPLINALCFFTAFLSCFLDNVTTALLMTPVIIRLCEMMKLNPVPVLISMIIFSNIGGAITPIGDPPNVIIALNADVIKAGINFGIFILHMGIGVIFIFTLIFFQLKFVYRNINNFKCAESEEIQELRQELALLQRTAVLLNSSSVENDYVKNSLMKTTSCLISKLKIKHNVGVIRNQDYNTCLDNLEQRYPIRDKNLLIKCCCALIFIVANFVLRSLSVFDHQGLTSTALFGALILLFLSNQHYIASILSRIEWATLVFFASLFVLMEALSRLGLIEWIGTQTHTIIMSVEQQHRLTVAIILILWVSAAASAFVDNIPLTTMMIRVAIALANNRDLQLPLQPLIWALSFGACLGGNGSLFGSSSNIVCAGVAEDHGYKISFIAFMRVGLPIMFTTTLLITIYLMICHVLFSWH